MTNFRFFNRIGTLRLILLLFTLATYPVVLYSDMEPEGIGMLTSYVTPSLVVIFFFLLLLDALMNRVFMIDAEGEDRASKRLRMWLDLAAVGGLLLCWMPYFRSIGQL